MLSCKVMPSFRFTSKPSKGLPWLPEAPRKMEKKSRTSGSTRHSVFYVSNKRPYPVLYCAILRKDSRCQKESNHQHLICKNFSSYVKCWLKSPLPTGQGLGLAYEKESFLFLNQFLFYKSI